MCHRARDHLLRITLPEHVREPTIFSSFYTHAYTRVRTFTRDRRILRGSSCAWVCSYVDIIYTYVVIFSCRLQLTNFSIRLIEIIIIFMVLIFNKITSICSEVCRKKLELLISILSKVCYIDSLFYIFNWMIHIFTARPLKSVVWSNLSRNWIKIRNSN